MVLGSLLWDGTSYSPVLYAVWQVGSGCGTCVGLQWSIIVRSLRGLSLHSD
jgi:bacterioferritin-associated ferredoxin